MADVLTNKEIKPVALSSPPAKRDTGFLFDKMEIDNRYYLKDGIKHYSHQEKKIINAVNLFIAKRPDIWSNFLNEVASNFLNEVAIIEIYAKAIANEPMKGGKRKMTRFNYEKFIPVLTKIRSNIYTKSVLIEKHKPVTF